MAACLGLLPSIAEVDYKPFDTSSRMRRKEDYQFIRSDHAGGSPFRFALWRSGMRPRWKSGALQWSICIF